MSEGRAVTHWQHLSPWAVLLLAVRGIGGFVRENLPLVVGAGAGAAFIEAIGLREILLGGALLLVGIGALSLQYYRRFRFCLEDDVLRVQRGLFEQRELKVTAARVQHMSIEQPLYMRPFGVVRFSLDTPGGSTTEVDLPGIPRSVATALRDALGAARVEMQSVAAEAHPLEAPAPRILFRADLRGLALHGLTSNYAYMLAVALTPLLQPLERAARRRLGSWEEVEWLRWAAEHPVLVGAAVLTVLVLTLVLASVVAAVVRFYGYRLLRDDGRYVQTSGLLNRQEQALSAPKLQSVEWVQTAIGLALGRGHLVCRQYGGTPVGGEHLGHSFLVPGLDRPTATRLSGEFWPDLDVGAWRVVHPAYRRLQAWRFGAFMAAAVSFIALLNGDPRWLAALLLVPLPAWLLGHLRWRAVAWQSGARYTLVRHGLLGRRTTMFPLDHVQSVTLRQSWFQRRRRLATLQLVLASGPVTIPYLAAAEARGLADEALYRVERRAWLS